MPEVPSDIEIAQAAKLKPIKEVAAAVGLTEAGGAPAGPRAESRRRFAARVPRPHPSDQCFSTWDRATFTMWKARGGDWSPVRLGNSPPTPLRAASTEPLMAPRS